MNVFLIIVAAVVFVLILIAVFYFLVYFQHPEDRNVAIFPKVVVVIGLSLSCVAVLLLPFDVANARISGGLDIPIIWQIIYLGLAAFAVLLIPFAIFYYEADEPDLPRSKQIKSALLLEGITIAIVVIVIAIMYAFLGYADVPVRHIQSEFVAGTSSVACQNCKGTAGTFSVRVTLPVYIISMLSFVGMFLFVTMGGVGLTALPMDLINSFRMRPKRIELDEFSRQKVTLHERSRKLMAIGQKLEQELKGKWRKTTKQQRVFNKFKQAVYILEQDWERLKVGYKQKGGSPLKYYALLFLGIISVSISVMWIVHIIAYNLAHATPMLNNLLLALDTAMGLMGTIAYGVYSFYLMMCVIKGTTKVGLRFPFISIHPMVVHETLMNSFLFNTMLIILSAVHVVQFCANSFGLYVTGTAVEFLFGIQVQYLRFITYIYQYYLYVLLGFALLAFIYLLVFPKDKSKADELDDE